MNQRGRAMLLILLLSLFAAVPSWAQAHASTKSVEVDQLEARATKCVTRTDGQAFKSAKPGQPPIVLGSAPTLVSTFNEGPAARQGGTCLGIVGHDRRSANQARAPPAR